MRRIEDGIHVPLITSSLCKCSRRQQRRGCQPRACRFDSTQQPLTVSKILYSFLKRCVAQKEPRTGLIRSMIKGRAAVSPGRGIVDTRCISDLRRMHLAWILNQERL